MWTSSKSDDGVVTLTDLDKPLDILRLCEGLVDIVPDAQLKVTLPMLGRVAFLVRWDTSHFDSFSNLPQRQVLLDVNGGAKFWDKVDEQLVKLRTKRDGDPALISKCVLNSLLHLSTYTVRRDIAKVLKSDCRTYGNPDLSLFT